MDPVRWGLVCAAGGGNHRCCGVRLGGSESAMNASVALTNPSTPF